MDSGLAYSRPWSLEIDRQGSITEWHKSRGVFSAGEVRWYISDNYGPHGRGPRVPTRCLHTLPILLPFDSILQWHQTPIPPCLIDTAGSHYIHFNVSAPLKFDMYYSRWSWKVSVNITGRTWNNTRLFNQYMQTKGQNGEWLIICNFYVSNACTFARVTLLLGLVTMCGFVDKS